MAKVNPRTLSGFMELLPAEQMKFERMLQILRESYAGDNSNIDIAIVGERFTHRLHDMVFPLRKKTVARRYRHDIQVLIIFDAWQEHTPSLMEQSGYKSMGIHLILHTVIEKNSMSKLEKLILL